MKNLLAILIFAFLSIGTSLGQQTDFALARLVETPTKKFSAIIVTYETGETEILDIPNWPSMSPTQKGIDMLVEAQQITTKFMNDMSRKGYKLVSTSAQEGHTLLIFSKND